MTYFFPPPLSEETVKKDMDELSLEIQMYFEQIYGDELKKLLITVAKEFAEFDPTEFVIKSAPLIFDRLEKEKELSDFLNGNKKI